MKKNYSLFSGFSAGKIVKAAALFLGLSAFNASAQYCQPIPYSTGDEEIYNVMVNGSVTPVAYSFANGCTTQAPGPNSALNRYANFRTLGAIFSATQGVVSTFSVQEDECDGYFYYNNGMAIFIDYNQDGDWVDAGEQIYMENNTTVSPRTVSNTFVVPFSAPTGTTMMRVIVAEGYSGAQLTPCLQYSYGETEDYVINIVAGQQCVGTPGSNTIVPTTTLVCPVFGTSTMTLSTTYTVGGINYTWMQSTQSNFGPWVNATGNFTQTAYTTPTLNTTTYYQLVAQCVWGGASQSVAAVQINVANTTTNTVPYFEGFEGITSVGQLPNCSWQKSDVYQTTTRIAMQSAWRQARTGTKFGEFDGSNYVYAQTRYFYSNGVYLNAGITYSASVWYNTPGYTTWINFSLLYGPNQSPTGLVQLASVQYPQNSTYQPLSNTFTVATSGLYYAAIRAQDNYSGSQMVWDDLQIIAPCTFTNNAASISLTGSTSICAGQSAVITATGASTYTWSNGPNTNAITVSPMFTTNYSVTGTNPLSGCLGTAVKNIVVNQLPQVGILAFKTTVCEGESVSMQAISANNYTWSAGPSTMALITVTPTQNANTYTVVGSDVFGCTNQAVQTINVNPLPVISVTGNTMICMGNAANLTGSGAGPNGSYEWKASNLYLISNPISASPQVTTTYMVTGTDGTTGCKGSQMVTVAVDPCTGINSITGSSNKVSVYPNPNNGMFTVELNNSLSKTIEVIDVTGRIVLSNTTSNNVVDVNISALSNGVYYVKVKSENTSEVIKIVKQ